MKMEAFYKITSNHLIRSLTYNHLTPKWKKVIEQKQQLKKKTKKRDCGACRKWRLIVGQRSFKVFRFWLQNVACIYQPVFPFSFFFCNRFLNCTPRFDRCAKYKKCATTREKKNTYISTKNDSECFNSFTKEFIFPIDNVRNSHRMKLKSLGV